MNQEHEPDKQLLHMIVEAFPLTYIILMSHGITAGGSVILRKLSRQQIINDFSIERKRKLLRYSVRKQKTK